MTNAQPRLMALLPGQARPSLQPLSRSEYCAQTTGAVATTTAHSAPMAMRFYSGTRFPEAYRSDAFVAMRGSWNAGNPVGYKVVRVRFDASGAPTGFEDFVTGFIDEGGATQYGRPVGIAFTPDGAMLVSDDTNGAIYRVAYTGF
jgi:glucose/arabinose dehydrogenase